MSHMTSGRHEQKVKHHYLSRFYLAAFTDDGTRRGALTVVDRWSGSVRGSRPGSEAFEKHYNTVSGPRPDIAEDILAKFEGTLAPPIKDFVKHRSFLSNGHVDCVTLYLAFMHVTTPVIRSTYNALVEEHIQYVYDTMTYRGEFPPLDPNLPPKVREALKYVRAKADIPPDWFLSQLPQAMSVIWELFKKRKWRVILATDDSGDLVSCDRPIALERNDVPVGMIRDDVRFDEPNTTVYVPMGKKVGLLGSSDRTARSIMADRTMVASLNSIIAMNAQRWIYCSSSDVEFMFRGGITTMEEYLKQAGLG